MVSPLTRGVPVEHDRTEDFEYPDAENEAPEISEQYRPRLCVGPAMSIMA